MFVVWLVAQCPRTMLLKTGHGTDVCCLVGCSMSKDHVAEDRTRYRCLLFGWLLNAPGPCCLRQDTVQMFVVWLVAQCPRTMLLKTGHGTGVCCLVGCSMSQDHVAEDRTRYRCLLFGWLLNVPGPCCLRQDTVQVFVVWLVAQCTRTMLLKTGHGTDVCCLVGCSMYQDHVA